MRLAQVLVLAGLLCLVAIPANASGNLDLPGLWVGSEENPGASEPWVVEVRLNDLPQVNLEAIVSDTGPSLPLEELGKLLEVPLEVGPAVGKVRFKRPSDRAECEVDVRAQTFAIGGRVLNEFSSPLVVRAGQVFVPLEIVAQGFEVVAKWDSSTQTVDILCTRAISTLARKAKPPRSAAEEERREVIEARSFRPITFFRYDLDQQFGLRVTSEGGSREEQSDSLTTLRLQTFGHAFGGTLTLAADGQRSDEDEGDAQFSLRSATWQKAWEGGELVLGDTVALFSTRTLGQLGLTGFRSSWGDTGSRYEYLNPVAVSGTAPDGAEVAVRVNGQAAVTGKAERGRYRLVIGVLPGEVNDVEFQITAPGQAPKVVKRRILGSDAFLPRGTRSLFVAGGSTKEPDSEQGPRWLGAARTALGLGDKVTANLELAGLRDREVGEEGGQEQLALGRALVALRLADNIVLKEEYAASRLQPDYQSDDGVKTGTLVKSYGSIGLGRAVMDLTYLDQSTGFTTVSEEGPEQRAGSLRLRAPLGSLGGLSLAYDETRTLCLDSTYSGLRSWGATISSRLGSSTTLRLGYGGQSSWVEDGGEVTASGPDLAKASLGVTQKLTPKLSADLQSSLKWDPDAAPPSPKYGECSLSLGYRWSGQNRLNWDTVYQAQDLGVGDHNTLRAGLIYSRSAAKPGQPVFSLGASVEEERQASRTLTRSWIGSAGVGYRIRSGGSVEVRYEFRERDEVFGSGKSEIQHRLGIRIVDGVGLSGGKLVSTGGLGEIQAKVGLVSGTVFLDANHNGLRDPGEPGLPGIMVALDEFQTAETDASGLFRFIAVAPGVHRLDFDLFSLPVSYSPTVDPKWVEVAAAGLVTQDLGLTVVSAVTGRVYVDVNRNGAFDAGDLPATNVRILIRALNRETRTDETGGFYLGELPAGAYQVELDAATLPAGATGGSPRAVVIAGDG
ncbi:MAG: SdrD B-like domain-containing protein, partial [Methanocella sp.]